jgi:hypothetical protein
VFRVLDKLTVSNVGVTGRCIVLEWNYMAGINDLVQKKIPPGAWMSVCFECCVLSGRGLCDELITCPEESYRLWCVVCDLEKK